MGDMWMAPRWVSEAPSQLAGLGESKGRIAAGYEADLVLVDPRRGTVFQPRAMKSRQRRGVLDGLRSEFSIKAVYLRGTPVTRASGREVRPATPARERS